MNSLWSEKNKQMQRLLKKSTFGGAVTELIELRGMLMDEMRSWRGIITDEQFSAAPFINADGYHSKTATYSIWHIFRIEDIVVNTLIRNREEVLFENDFIAKINAPIVTTGNELIKEEIVSFSEKLDIDALYEYAEAVKASSEEWLKTADGDILKQSFSEADKERIRSRNVVSGSDEAAWLIDYWCGKDISGLIKMPLSRHWIMHVEAAVRIINKIKKS